MKFLDKLVLKIFSIIILVLTVCAILIMTNIITIEDISNELVRFLDGENGIKILIGIIAILMLFAIKGLFFTSKSNKDTSKDGIVLENNSGKLIISKESLENLIYSVVKDIPGAETVTSRTILDKDKNLIVNVTVIVSKDIMLKDITTELQRKVKEAMKNTADLDVKEVNIRIKNITSKKIKGLPAPNDSENEAEESPVVEETESSEEITEESNENE